MTCVHAPQQVASRHRAEKKRVAEARVEAERALPVHLRSKLGDSGQLGSTGGSLSATGALNASSSLRARAEAKKAEAEAKSAEDDTRAVLVVVERVAGAGPAGVDGKPPPSRVQVRVEASDRRDAEVVSRVLLLGTMMYSRVKTQASAKRMKAGPGHGAPRLAQLGAAPPSALPYLNPWRPPTVGATPSRTPLATPIGSTRLGSQTPSSVGEGLQLPSIKG
jgi:hypothetical protein